MPTRKGSAVWMGLALAGLLGLAGAARADLASAQAAYKDGLAKQAAKDYDGAIASYQAALGQEPRYVYAWKQIGTCRYLKGDKVGAVAAYDKYLAVVKNDPKTQAFADGLRAPGETPLDTGTPAERRAAKAAAPEGPEPGFRVGLDLGVHTVSFGQWNSDWASVPAAGTHPTIDLGESVGLEFGYKVLPRLEVGLDLDYFLVSAQVQILSGLYTYDFNYTYNAVWVGPYVGYDILHGRRFSLNANLGVGYLSMMGSQLEEKLTYSYTGASSTYTETYTGSTVGFRGGAGMDWRLGSRFQIFGNLGYRLANISTVNYTNSNGGSGTYKGVMGNGNVGADYSGVDFRVGAAFTF